MGCVPSRCLYCYTPGTSRNQHHGGGRRISILRSVSTPLRKRRSHGNHHHHFVALTSTTYGLLRWNSNASSSPAGTDGNDTEELMMTPMDDDRSSSQETPFFDTASVSNYEDCCTCTDKEVVGVVNSSSKGPLDDSAAATGLGNCLDVSGAASVSSSSSCVNKLVSLDQFCQQQKQQLQQFQQPEVINIWELMEGLEEDCSRSLLSPRSSPSLRMKSPLARHPGKRRMYHRSVSLSAMQATKKLDSILTVDGISPATLERVLKEIYNYYVNSRCRNLLNKPFSSSTPCSPASKKKQQNTSTPKKLKPRSGKENSTPKFDKSPVCFDKSLFSSFRRKERSCSNSPFRSRPVNATENAIEKEPLGFSFSFFKQESQGDSRPRTPPISRKQQGMVTPRTPASPMLARRKSRGESPLFRTAAAMIDKTQQQQQQQLKKKVSCCNCCCCKNNSEKSNNNHNLSAACDNVKKSLGSGSFFDPELLASIERAFKSLSVEDWYSSREEDLGGASDDSSSTSNEEVPLMGAAKRSVTNSKGNRTPPVAATTPTSPGFGLWDSFWALRDGLAASGTAKKISFSKVSPLDHHQEEQQQQQHEEEDEGSNPLDSFELRCPPGGDSSVVLYCTSLRGIRKTFEECHNLQMILRSTGVCIDERDVSMHSDFRLELKELLNNEEPGSAASVPKVFIRGRYIGGAEKVRKLHEEGKLVKMLEGIPKEDPFSVCDGCGGLRFIPCLECSGSCKLVFCEQGMNKVSRCPDCNENGLIRCPICC